MADAQTKGADAEDEEDAPRAPFITDDLLIALVQQRFGASVQLAQNPADPAMAWKARADDYKVSHEYKGPDTYRTFIAVLAATGSVPFARRQSLLTASRLTRRMERYPEFAAAMVMAQEHYAGAVLERAASTRAIDGVLKPVWYKGTLIGKEIVYSDNLLIRLLEGAMPEKYKPRALLDIDNTIVIEGGLPPMPTTIDQVPEEMRKLLEQKAQEPQAPEPEPTPDPLAE